MPNRLAGETSPYLLEHANNPVEWYPWGKEALSTALRADKPIMLSIGYSACHWCHVMARESFEDSETAALINRHFVAIKVDREERPDLDQVYMRAVQGMTGSGGWPMTMFLLPDGTPFYGGTYFPPAERFGMPSFRRVLTAVAEAYSLRRSEVRGTAARIKSFLQQPPGVVGPGTSLTVSLLDQAYDALARDYDMADGGFGGAPKFPQPMLIEFLLRTNARTGAARPLEIATNTLHAMAKGGIYDQLGGGFHRYAVDAAWQVPHFEKMLYDNALLARVYLDAWQVTGDAGFLRVGTETIDFVLRELSSPEGGFFSSLDADSEGEEGRFYVWTPDEVRQALGDDSAKVLAAFGVTPEGNFDRNSIPHAVESDASAIMTRVRGRWLAARNQRTRPNRDEKVLAGWNGLMLRALAEAAYLLERDDYLERAGRNAGFLLSRMMAGQRMRRSYKEGRTSSAGYLEDQAAVADGLLALYQASFERDWLDAAGALVEEMVRSFWDPATGAFFDTALDQETLVVRPQDVTDNALPSGTSMAVDVLLRLGHLLGREDWVTMAVQVLERLSGAAARSPLAFGRLLAALDFQLARPIELAIVGMPQSLEVTGFRRVIRSHYLPNRVLAHAPNEFDAPPIPLLQDRPLKGGLPTAYLCEGFSCQAPTNDPDELQRQLQVRLATSRAP